MFLEWKIRTSVSDERVWLGGSIGNVVCELE